MAYRLSHLVDTSALGRLTHTAVSARLGPLIRRGRVASCAVVDLEMLFSARDFSDYEATLAELRGMPVVEITQEVMDGAIEIQRELARRAQHRLPVSDLMIASAAAMADLAILHYDAHFERISDVTGQPHEWVVSRGSI